MPCKSRPFPREPRCEMSLEFLLFLLEHNSFLFNSAVLRIFSPVNLILAQRRCARDNLNRRHNAIWLGCFAFVNFCCAVYSLCLHTPSSGACWEMTFHANAHWWRPCSIIIYERNIMCHAEKSQEPASRFHLFLTGRRITLSNQQLSGSRFYDVFP